MAAACFSFLFKGSKPTVDDDYEIGVREGVRRVKGYSYKELSNATDHVSEANKLGQGGFGKVYKAKFKDGSLAAVKVLLSESLQGVKEFLTEINVISNVHHENLVQLYGYCIEGGHRMLVYQYLENNSLSKTLLGGDGNDGIKFSWKIRKKICIGIARGLAYLHEELDPHVLHRDIKASNILLDRDLNARISDFGLAKLIPPNKTHISTRVAGTIGYMAPEYAYSGHVTRKCDIYSFGVLLLEIVSGRSNTSLWLSNEDRYLLEMTWRLHERNELVAVVDSNLDGQFNAEEACRFLKVGLLCTQDSAKLRPPMSKIARMLEGRKDVDVFKITKPGLISDFLMPKDMGTSKRTSSDVLKSDFLSSDATRTSLTITAICDRD